MPECDREEVHTNYGAGVAVILSALLWTSASVLGVLVDTDGQCFNSLRFGTYMTSAVAYAENFHGGGSLSGR